MVPKIFRQRHVDNGQIGGLISVFISSMFIFSFFTFINTMALVYQSILKYYVSIETFVVLIGVVSLTWMGLYYAIVMPSQQQFSSRQSYIHNNPVKKDMEDIKKSIAELREELDSVKCALSFIR